MPLLEIEYHAPAEEVNNTTTKEPAKYLSKKTNNPIQNNCYYYTCPVSEEYKIGAKYGTEMYKALQEWKKHIKNAVNKVIRSGKITVAEGDILETKTIEDFEEQRLTQTPLINPEWEEWVKVNKKVRSTNTTAKDNKVKQQDALIKSMAEKILKLEQDLMDKEDEVAELKEDNSDLNAQLGDLNEQVINQNEQLQEEKERVGRRDATIEQLAKNQKPKKKVKAKAVEEIEE